MANTPIILFALLVLAFAVGLAMPEAERNAPPPSGLVGKPLPPLVLRDLDSEAVLHRAAFEGAITVVNIFASWCAPCVLELPEFAALKALSERVRIVGIGWHDSPHNLRAWVAEHHAPFDAIYTDPNRQIGVQLGIRGVPETYVLDPSGVVRMHIPGPVHETLRLKSIAPLIQELADAQ